MYTAEMQSTVAVVDCNILLTTSLSADPLAEAN